MLIPVNVFLYPAVNITTWIKTHWKWDKLFESCVQLEISYQVSKTRVHNNLLQTEGQKNCIVSSILNILSKTLTETVNNSRTMPIYCAHTSSTQLHVMASAFGQRIWFGYFNGLLSVTDCFVRGIFPQNEPQKTSRRWRTVCGSVGLALRCRSQRRIWEIEWLMLPCVYRILFLRVLKGQSWSWISLLSAKHIRSLTSDPRILIVIVL